jgi:predicted ATPase
VLLALGREHLAEAEASFTRACAEAARQGARFWELRATAALARLLAERGEADRARDLLAPVHGWFTEGLDIPDMDEAKALLEALASVPLRSQETPGRCSAIPVNNPGFRNGPSGVKPLE